MPSDKTATERLRELLDERGVEWWYGIGEKSTVFDGEHDVRYEVDGTLGLLFIRSALDVTPDQAIDATLGRGTCKDVCADVSEFTCDACGFNCELASWISLFDGDDGRHRHHYHGTPNFCPNCGRKVVDE